MPKISLYLSLSDLIKNINQRYKLSDKEVSVLDIVVKKYLKQEPFRVLDLILLSQIASQATLHSIMTQLISKKLLETEISLHDGRVKFVKPTTLALDRLAECDLATLSCQDEALEVRG
jgi:DNA-binding MarR family transcriptional regulator